MYKTRPYQKTQTKPKQTLAFAFDPPNYLQKQQQKRKKSHIDSEICMT